MPLPTFHRRFGPVQTNFLVEGFYTDLRNVFILEEIGRDNDNNLLMERRNGKGARVMGINLEAKAVYSWMPDSGRRNYPAQPLQRTGELE